MTGVANLVFPLNGPIGITYDGTVHPDSAQEVSNPSSSSSEDSFQRSSNSQEVVIETQPSQQGFFSRLFQRVVHAGRNIWRTLRRYNPFTQLFNLIESVRVRPHVNRSASRNGATTNDEIRQYHESLLYNEQNPHDNRIFRAYLGNEDRPRPLVVLFLGNGQTHNTPEHQAGILRLAQRLQRDRDTDVLVFRVGCASNELRHRFCIGGDPSLHTSVVYQHSVNVIEDYINARGIFVGRRPPSRVVFGGYSFGGGTIDRLLREDWQRIGGNIPVTGSFYIDAIRLGSYDLGDAVEQRPLHSVQHLNFYQQNSTAINGNHVNDLRPSDVSVPIISTDHAGIDDSEEVQNRAYRFIRNAILRN